MRQSEGDIREGLPWTDTDLSHRKLALWIVCQEINLTHLISQWIHEVEPEKQAPPFFLPCSIIQILRNDTILNKWLPVFSSNDLAGIKGPWYVSIVQYHALWGMGKQLSTKEAERWKELAAPCGRGGCAEHSSQVALLPRLAQLVSAEPAVYLYSIALLSPPAQRCVGAEVGQEVAQEEEKWTRSTQYHCCTYVKANYHRRTSQASENAGWTVLGYVMFLCTGWHLGKKSCIFLHIVGILLQRCCCSQSCTWGENLKCKMHTKGKLYYWVFIEQNVSEAYLMQIRYSSVRGNYFFFFTIIFCC